MPSVGELITRWPALEVSARRVRLERSLRCRPGSVGAAVARLAPRATRAAEGLWRRDPATWSDDPQVQQHIAQRLGWLSAPWEMAEALDRLRRFAAAIRTAGFTDVVLLGMGGSSLAPDVLRAVLGASPGWPRLHVLDSTDPGSIRATDTDVRRTLYLLASKSGTTIEPNALAAYFRARLEAAGRPWADHFVAITDAGTDLEIRARRERFRDVFINPSDVGGRYSALSFFGLVPAALMGQDLAAILGWGLAMLAAAQPQDGHDEVADPASPLGLLMGAAARDGRDKLTLVLPPAIEPFGAWVEQLVAESTGKQGVGIVPIAGEPIADAAAFGSDRLFAVVRLADESQELYERAAHDLARAGAPVAVIDVPEPAALGAEFVRWEIATAVAGALLAINPFDEPDVNQAKEATRRLLSADRPRELLLTSPPATVLPNGAALRLTGAARARLMNAAPQAILTLAGPREYVALLAFLDARPDVHRALQALRMAIRDGCGTATMLGFGPRYLHSTGQLHKGGPNSGVFVLLTAAPTEDLAVPGERFSFGTLELAQALGDFAALDAAGRRALHVHLPVADQRAIEAAADLLLDPIRAQPS